MGRWWAVGGRTGRGWSAAAPGRLARSGYGAQRSRWAGRDHAHAAYSNSGWGWRQGGVMGGGRLSKPTPSR